ncbi:MAG: hypothetical protein HC854_02315 [Flavobacterium sp.]|nr:hypothetical protein [Flavobacterium sp.]
MKTTFSLKKELDTINSKAIISLSNISFNFPMLKIEKSTSILERLNVSNDTLSNQFNFDKLETEKIYHINAIKKICISNRLRFLDTKYYKNEYPKSVIQTIRAFENTHETEINHFKIVAPKNNFKLNNYDDPLLFMSLGNGYYYLLDYWGNDIHWTRKLKALPFKNLFNLTVTTLIVSIFLTYFFSLFKSDSLSVPYQLVIFLFTWKSVIAVTFYTIIQSGNNVSEYNWNSQFYNK